MTENSSSLIKYFSCGGFGGMCNVLTGHPMDTIKVRLQTMPAPKAGEKAIYTGAWDCLTKTIKKEGFRGPYKGISAPLTGVTPTFAICFFSFGLGKKLIKRGNDRALRYSDLLAAGAFSGAITASVRVPIERLKCLLQIQQSNQSNKPKIYYGLIDCAIKLYAVGGIRSLYKGSAATLIRDIPNTGVYFATYELVKVRLSPENADAKVKVGATICAGGIAGIAYWTTAMPADVMKSRIQTAPEGTYPNGIRDVFMQLLKTEGPKAFYRGITPVMIRAFPANAACFGGFELASKFFSFTAPNL